MEIELVEIRDFLAQHHPFDHLPPTALDHLPRRLTVRYLRRGSPFPPHDAPLPSLLVLRTGAVELRSDSDDLIEKLGEGDCYSVPCASDVPSPPAEGALKGRVVEDSLFYLLPCTDLAELRRSHPEFDAHFHGSIKGASGSIADPTRSGVGLMAIEVGKLLGRTPISCGPDTSIREAAQLMTRERVSALLVIGDTGLLGIVTDRDLRARCIAQGCDYANPVRMIMSDKVVRIPADTSAFEALMLMTRMNVHHLPVVERRQVLGMISTTDLTRYQSASSVHLVGDITKAEGPEALAELSRQTGELHIQLVHAGVTPSQLGQAISSITDALTQRLLQLAQERIGPAPLPFAWVAVGSHARREQTVHSDQDHALILDDGYRPEAHGAYFESLARFVADGLHACGLFYCPGGVMATTPEWRQSLSGWRARFERWIKTPERKSLMLACNFFDIRPVYGEIALFDRLRAAVLPLAQGDHIFLAHLAHNALNYRPPLGFFRDFVVIRGGEHDNALDLKRRGLIPIIDLARIHALASGVPEIATGERLDAAAEAGTLSAEGAENLGDAWAFIGALRARHQADQMKRGIVPDNYIRPDGLSRFERARLKEAFAVISTLQDALAQRYQTDRFF